jgi:hypothetical protein
MEVIIAVCIAVCGWLANHCLSLRAQNKAFLNNIRNEARLKIESSLKEYYLLLHSIITEYEDFENKYVNLKIRAQRPESVFVNAQRLISLISSFEFRPEFILLLESYESLFPETKDARDILQHKNHELKTHFDEIYKKVSNTNIIMATEISRPILSIDLSVVAAQKWLVQDLLIIIQNITLGNITGHKVKQWGITGIVPVRHPRFILNKKGKIILKITK